MVILFLCALDNLVAILNVIILIKEAIVSFYRLDAWLIKLMMFMVYGAVLYFIIEPEKLKIMTNINLLTYLGICTFPFKISRLDYNDSFC
jgi:hypothetical protein